MTWLNNCTLKLMSSLEINELVDHPLYSFVSDMGALVQPIMMFGVHESFNDLYHVI